jgi:Fe-S-cluster-containing dehydrogenase component
MSKVFVVDVNHCNGCFNCQVVCKDEHCNQPWLPYAEAQPMTGQYWCRVDQQERGQVPWVRVAYKPVFCNHCGDEAPCKKIGGEAIYTREDGLVIIDPAKAKGLRQLVDACPIGAIFYNDELDIAQKCTGCAHLLDNGWGAPRCVDACATDALRYVEESEVDLSTAEILEGVAGLGGRVYYLNLPKRFIAGTVVDVADDEVVIGAAVELKDSAGDVVATLISDELGDFKFDQIEKGAYTVSVAGRDFAANVTERDLSLGDCDVST